MLQFNMYGIAVAAIGEDVKIEIGTRDPSIGVTLDSSAAAQTITFTYHSNLTWLTAAFAADGTLPATTIPVGHIKYTACGNTMLMHQTTGVVNVARFAAGFIKPADTGDQQSYLVVEFPDLSTHTVRSVVSKEVNANSNFPHSYIDYDCTTTSLVTDASCKFLPGNLSTTDSKNQSAKLVIPLA